MNKFWQVIVAILIIGTFLFSCNKEKERKINGVSFVATPHKVTETHITPVVALHANYAAIMPFGFVKSIAHPKVLFNTNKQWYGETVVGVNQNIIMLKKSGIKIMLKPQLWVWDGVFTGIIKMNTEEDWRLFELGYERFILTFAEVAEKNDVAIFCIGTELEFFIKHRPEFWENLIKKVRAVYKGKLTYAANWNEYTQTPFWAKLDYIGVDAYFPLVNEKTPSVNGLRLAWDKPKLLLKKYSDSLQKKILFTEFGYRSVAFTAHKPWDVAYDKTTVNLQGQTNATKVLFEQFWKENWFAGGFLWKWFPDYVNSGGVHNARFTPQNKPAEEVVREVYLKYK